MAVEKPNKEKFTFWANMRETIEQNENVELKYKLYSALTNYGLYGIEPDENDKDYGIIMMLLQSMKLTIDKSKEVSEQKAASGAKGGEKEKITDGQMLNAIVEATKKKNKKPTQNDVIDMCQELYNITVNRKTLSRREGIGDAEGIKKISDKVLKGTFVNQKDEFNF